MKKVGLGIAVLLALAGCASMTISRSDIENATKIYFVPLYSDPLVVVFTAHKPQLPAASTDTPKSIELRQQLLRPEDIEAVNRIFFEKMKLVAGDKLQMVPKQYETVKKVLLVAEVKTHDFDRLDCDVYFKLQLELPGTVRKATYSLSGPDFERESYLVRPSGPDISIWAYKKTHRGYKTIFTQSSLLVGYHSMEVGGSLDLGKALEQIASGKKAQETTYSKVIETDYFNWKVEYAKDEGRLKADFSQFVDSLRMKVLKRIDDTANEFSEQFFKTMEENEQKQQ